MASKAPLLNFLNTVPSSKTIVSVLACLPLFSIWQISFAPDERIGFCKTNLEQV